MQNDYNGITHNGQVSWFACETPCLCCGLMAVKAHGLSPCLQNSKRWRPQQQLVLGSAAC